MPSGWLWSSPLREQEAESERERERAFTRDARGGGGGEGKRNQSGRPRDVGPVRRGGIRGLLSHFPLSVRLLQRVVVLAPRCRSSRLRNVGTSWAALPKGEPDRSEGPPRCSASQPATPLGCSSLGTGLGEETLGRPSVQRLSETPSSLLPLSLCWPRLEERPFLPHCPWLPWGPEAELGMGRRTLPTQA